MYNQKVMQHFVHPQNAGSIKKPDAIGKAFDDNNGDVVKIYLKINSDSQCIEEATFKTLGSPLVIACCDVVCEKLKGEHIDEAENITSMDIITMFESVEIIPVEKIGFVATIVDAIVIAIKNYKKKYIQ